MNMPFEEWLKERVAQKGMTLQQFAKLIGVSYFALRSWCKGDYQPRISNVVRMAKGLQLPLAEIRSALKASYTPRADRTEPGVLSPPQHGTSKEPAGELNSAAA